MFPINTKEVFCFKMANSKKEFNAEFKTSFKKNESDFIYLNIRISESFQKVLKEVTINEKMTFNHYSADRYNSVEAGDYGCAISLKRFKVKGWAFSCLSNSFRDYLFNEDLIKKGGVILKFSNCEHLEYILNGIRIELKNAVEVIKKYSSLKMSVKYSLEK